MKTIIDCDVFKSNIDNKYYYFYKIINTLNGKYYYGVHETFNINDYYSGSGVLINKSYKKYGKENFEKHILKFFNSKEDMYSYENKIVNIDEINNILSYNSAIGGDIPPNRKGIKSMKIIDGKLVGVSYGDVWIKKENRCIKIKGHDLDKYLSEGWVRGRIINNYKKPHITKTIHITKDGNNKNIEEFELDKYLSEGWVRGRSLKNTSKDKLWIHNDKIQMYILKSELDKYLSEGWAKGMIAGSSRKNHTYVSKENKCLSVLKSELDKYLSEGWVKGRYNGKKRTPINNGRITKMIYEFELDKYLSEGWVKGSLQTYNNKYTK